MAERLPLRAVRKGAYSILGPLRAERRKLWRISSLEGHRQSVCSLGLPFHHLLCLRKREKLLTKSTVRFRRRDTRICAEMPGEVCRWPGCSRGKPSTGIWRYGFKIKGKMKYPTTSYRARSSHMEKQASCKTQKYCMTRTRMIGPNEAPIRL